MAYPGDTHSITLAMLEEISTFIAEVANTKRVGNKRWVETKSMAALDIFADLGKNRHVFPSSQGD